MSLQVITYAVFVNQVIGFISMNRVSGSIQFERQELAHVTMEAITLFLPLVANQMCISSLVPRHKNKLSCGFFILLYLTLINRFLGPDYVFQNFGDFMKRISSLLVAVFVILYIF